MVSIVILHLLHYNCNTMVSIFILHYNIMGPPSSMRSVVDRKVVMQRMTVYLSSRCLTITECYLCHHHHHHAVSMDTNSSDVFKQIAAAYSNV